MSPFEALFGYKLSLLPALPSPTSVAVVDEHLQKRQQTLQQLKKDLAMALNRMKKLVDKSRSEREFGVGERVYLKLKGPYLKSLSLDPVSKLSPRYFGPFRIVSKVGNVAYKVQLLQGT